MDRITGTIRKRADQQREGELGEEERAAVAHGLRPHPAAATVPPAAVRGDREHDPGHGAEHERQRGRDGDVRLAA